MGSLLLFSAFAVITSALRMNMGQFPELEFTKLGNWTGPQGLPLDLLKEEFAELGLTPSADLKNFLMGNKLQLDKEALPNHKPTIWMHFHKAGGTFACTCANINGEKIVSPNGNCNGIGDGGSGGLYHDKFIKCEDRKARGYTWAGVERVYTQPWCFDDFDYATWLRDPIGLAESEANQKHPEPRHPELQAVYVQQNLDCSAGGACPKMYQSGSDTIPLWKYFDNYAVRVLLGEEVYKLPPGQITEEHAKAALAILDKFRVKVIMEKVLKDEAYRNNFMKQLDWHHWPAETTQTTNRREVRTIKFTESQREQMRKQNKWDYMLFDHVMAL